MNKTEITEWLEGEVLGFPQRATGNELLLYIENLCRRLLDKNRGDLVEAMRYWIVARGDRTLLACSVAAAHKLHELMPDIRRLLADVRAGKAFLPYYDELISRDLQQLENSDK